MLAMDVGWRGRHSQEQKFDMCSELDSNHTLLEHECLSFNELVILIESDLLLFNLHKLRKIITHSEIYTHCKSEYLIILFWEMPNQGTHP